jgi:hypothetical protein
LRELQTAGLVREVTGRKSFRAFTAWSLARDGPYMATNTQASLARFCDGPQADMTGLIQVNDHAANAPVFLSLPARSTDMAGP